MAEQCSVASNERSVLEKLNIKKYPKKLVLEKPDGVSELDSIDYDEKPVQKQYDCIFAFVTSLKAMEKHIHTVAKKSLLINNGYLFFVYPKMGNKAGLPHIHRDSIMPYLNIDDSDGIVPGTNLKFSRMVSFNETYTLIGLKMILPKKKR
jgi:hypothetical protein